VCSSNGLNAQLWPSFWRTFPAIDPNQREFKRTARWNWREVLPAFGVEPFDIHREILTAIDGRNAAFHCDLEAIAAYMDHGSERTTPPERITAVIEQQFLTQLANRGFEIGAPSEVAKPRD
jgi:hypothetical protein